MDDVCAQAREGSDVGKDGSGDVGRKGSYVDAGMKGKDDIHSIVVTMGGGDDAGRQERSSKGLRRYRHRPQGVGVGAWKIKITYQRYAKVRHCFSQFEALAPQPFVPSTSRHSVCQKSSGHHCSHKPHMPRPRTRVFQM